MKLDSLVICRNPLFTDRAGQLSGKATFSDEHGNQTIVLTSRAILKALDSITSELRATASANAHAVGEALADVKNELPDPYTL